MIGIFINLPDDLIKQIKQFIAPTPTAEIMKVHIQRWTRKNYFHLWFREHNSKVVRILSNRASKRMKYIKQRQDDAIKCLNKRGEDVTVEKLINRNYELLKVFEACQKKLWIYVD